MADGNIWTATVAYDGDDRAMSVTLRDGNQQWQYGITDYAIGLPAILGTNLAYIGFGAGTGDGYQNHDVLDWSFSNGLNYTNQEASAVPEPASLAVLAIALAGLARARHARQRR